MAQLDPLQKNSHSSKSITRSNNSTTFEQLLPGYERSWSASTSPTGYYDQEEYTPSKKSVISKVKEKAKKLKYSLSGKKKLQENDVHDDNYAPSWGVMLDDDGEEDVDPEYLGAPMYESEQAPEPYREAARQHPRADPVLSEKNITPRSIKHNQVFEYDNTEKLPDSPSKTIKETVTEKLGPAYAAVSDATHAIATKISNFTLTNTDNQESEIQNASKTGQHTQNASISNFTLTNTDNQESEIQNEPKTGQFADLRNVNKLGENVEQNASALANPVQKRDKGVSFKEYFAEKFEPGEGEKSLSQIITEAMSPRQSASHDTVVEEQSQGRILQPN